MRFNLKTLFFTLYSLFFILYSIYSYAFLDIGLTLTSFRPYLEFQKNMRYFGHFNRPTSALVFITLTFLLYFLYLLIFILKDTRPPLDKDKFLLWSAFIIFGSLIFAYPAFSHDIFNYIFNAKMVLVYHADPHRHAAWEFADPMLDFMRNIHTPAPYFYGWTLISLLPALVSFNRIFLSLINFKIFSLFLFWLTFIFLKKILKQLKFKEINLRLALFLLNPLVLIEAIGMGHNDFSMMAPALMSFYYLIEYKKKKKLKLILFSVFCFLFSVSIKYATIVLLPLLFIWYLNSKFDLGFWGAILLFLLPFSRPLNQLHSWYFIWPLTWIFLSKSLKPVYFSCLVSFFALLRYVPYIYYGNWDPPVLFLRLIIYLGPPLFLLPYFVWSKKLN